MYAKYANYVNMLIYDNLRMKENFMNSYVYVYVFQDNCPIVFRLKNNRNRKKRKIEKILTKNDENF